MMSRHKRVKSSGQDLKESHLHTQRIQDNLTWTVVLTICFLIITKLENWTRLQTRVFYAFSGTQLFNTSETVNYEINAYKPKMFHLTNMHTLYALPDDLYNLVLEYHDPHKTRLEKVHRELIFKRLIQDFRNGVTPTIGMYIKDGALIDDWFAPVDVWLVMDKWFLCLFSEYNGIEEHTFSISLELFLKIGEIRFQTGMEYFNETQMEYYMMWRSIEE